MNISHFHFILFNLKIFGEIVTTKKEIGGAEKRLNEVVLFCVCISFLFA